MAETMTHGEKINRAINSVYSETGLEPGQALDKIEVLVRNFRESLKEAYCHDLDDATEHSIWVKSWRKLNDNTYVAVENAYAILAHEARNI